MNYDSQLIKKILLEIKKNPKQKEKEINIPGFNYDDIVFPHLKYLWEEKFISAKPGKDESGEIVSLIVYDLSPKGEKYLKTLNT